MTKNAPIVAQQDLKTQELRGMKQHITTKQLNELSEKGKMKLGIWCSKKDIKINGLVNPYLSIGQMIEFLDQERSIGKKGFEMLGNEWCYINECGLIDFKDATKLCDALWEATKEILNELP